MLHLTNGSVALSRLHDLGLPGVIIPWDDVLHEGPVPAGLTPEAFRRVRAEFLALDWGDVISLERTLTERDWALEEAVTGDEIVLWFEHDLFDQLQVLEALDTIGRARARLQQTGARVTAILTDDYLGAQPDAQLRQWYDDRQPVTDEQWAAATEAWGVFRAPDPQPLGHFAHAGAWPTLLAAIRRHLQQFPSVHTGLSRTEGQTLAALADGPCTLREAFRRANHAVEEAVFMGDAVWWWHIRPLLTGPQPLLRVEGDGPHEWHHPDWWRDDDTAARLAMTAAGERVVAGDADHVVLNGIDRWLGGVRLVARPGGTDPVWRWDETAGVVVRH